MKPILALIVFCLLLPSIVCAQDNNYGVKGFYPQTLPLTDSIPVVFNGLKAGYEIRETELQSKKEDQRRCKLYFYITNTSTEAKIMYQNAGFMGHGGPITNNIATFFCKNATGARFTNKQCTMEIQPCYMLADVEDNDCATGKKVVNRRSVNIGYWIKPGETVSKTYLMYVPQNEKPNIVVTYNGEVANQTGSIIQSNNQPAYNNQQPVYNQPGNNSFNAYTKIKNYSHATYLNNQQGPLVCTPIENGWWSAEWQIIPVPGTNNFLIRNHWTNAYLNASSQNLLSGDNNSATCQWTIQESDQPSMYFIKNISNNARLYVEHGVLKISSSFLNNDLLSKWIIEQ